TVLDRECTTRVVVQGAAPADADKGRAVGDGAAVTGNSPVAREDAAGDGGGSLNVPDGTAEGVTAAGGGEGLIAAERAAADAEGGAIPVADGPAQRRVADSFVIGQDVVDEVQGTADVQDASPLAVGRPAGFDRQAGDGNRERLLVLTDVEDPASMVAADGQQA